MAALDAALRAKLEEFCRCQQWQHSKQSSSGGGAAAVEEAAATAAVAAAATATEALGVIGCQRQLGCWVLVLVGVFAMTGQQGGIGFGSDGRGGLMG